MKIGIVGAGPAGLYFALLMKRRDPSNVVRVVEQNPADATYGWGVVLSDRALSFLEENDDASYADLEPRLRTWNDQIVVHRDQRVRIDGLGFAGIARIELLRVLQAHCRDLGVEMQFDRRLTDLHELDDCDLVVGADGVNSVVREAHRDAFQPRWRSLSNRYVWYGTRQSFEALSLTFREDDGGAFVAHHYPFSTELSTFIVECDAATWERAGFDGLSEDERRACCERVFATDLGGHSLLSNKSQWLAFRVMTNRRWYTRNVVLIGDALRTVHFSIGSGTRSALEDAIELARALDSPSSVGEGLEAFEAARRPTVERFLEVAERSYRWYEHFHERMALEPLAFAYDYLTRAGRITRERLRERSPRFISSYEAAMASEGART